MQVDDFFEMGGRGCEESFYMRYLFMILLPLELPHGN